MKPRDRSAGCLPYSTPSIDALSVEEEDEEEEEEGEEEEEEEEE